MASLRAVISPIIPISTNSNRTQIRVFGGNLTISVVCNYYEKLGARSGGKISGSCEINLFMLEMVDTLEQKSHN